MESENYWLAAWNNFGVFSGRARRMEYWLFQLEVALVGLAVGVPLAILSETFESREMLTDSSSMLGLLILGVAVILSVLVAIVNLGVTVRRLHDTGRSGWWILIRIIPYIGGFILFIFLVMDSQAGENQYGPNPKGNGLRSQIDYYLHG